jgi:hypothetical protein
MVVFALLLGGDLGAIAFAAKNWGLIQTAYPGITGALGTLVGLTLWAIARPDRAD